MAMSDEMKAKLAAGRAAAKAKRQVEITGEVPPVTVAPTESTPRLQITPYKSFTIEIEQPDRVMACKDTCVRAQWYGNIDECVKKAQEYADGQE